MQRKPFYFSKTFWGLALTAVGVFAPRYVPVLQGAAQDVITLVGLAAALFGRWKAQAPLSTLPASNTTRSLLLLILPLPLLASSASAQTFVAGGFQIGGNNVEFRDTAKVNWQVFQRGTRIDKYSFFGGFAEGQYDYPLGKYAALSPKALAELTTDPKNLGQSRDGTRYHFRPEVELAARAIRKFAVVGHGGAGITRISNSQYSKTGFNPYAGIGLDFDKKYRFTVAKIFRDTTNSNDNATEGYRLRFDSLYPLGGKWGARVGFEYTRYYSNIPGLKDSNSQLPCGCVRTQGNAITFRVGLARMFKKRY